MKILIGGDDGFARQARLPARYLLASETLAHNYRLLLIFTITLSYLLRVKSVVSVDYHYARGNVVSPVIRRL